MKKMLLVTLGMLLCLASCNGGNQREVVKSIASSTTGKSADDWLHQAERYWNGFDYTDSQALGDTVRLARAFFDWVLLLGNLPQQESVPLMARFIRDGNEAPQMQLRLLELGESILNDPNSPYRNEELYIPMLEAIIGAPNIKEEYKERPRFQLSLAQKNRRFTKATDFTYITNKGEKGRLSELAKTLKARDRGGSRALPCHCILLYFNNPECHDCSRVNGYLSASKVIKERLSNGTLTLLAIYPDESLRAWHRHRSEYPSSWIAARYGSPRERKAYNLPAIPCLYLLNTDMMVLLKDEPVEKIEDYLRIHTIVR